jgi:hypothetical protein
LVDEGENVVSDGIVNTTENEVVVEDNVKNL